MISVNKKNKKKNAWIVIDSCPSGWISCYESNDILNINFAENLNALNLSLYTKIFIDMPVKLPSELSDYPRYYDKYAKSLLGAYHSSIFYAPLKPWLSMPLHSINSICENNNKPKLSIQSFNLFKKIHDVQKALIECPSTFQEIHPELIYHYFLKNDKQSKKTISGENQRLDFISNYLEETIYRNDINELKKKLKSQNNYPKINNDDIIDVLLVSVIIKFNKSLLLNNNNNNNDTLYNRFNLFK